MWQISCINFNHKVTGGSFYQHHIKNKFVLQLLVHSGRNSVFEHLILRKRSIFDIWCQIPGMAGLLISIEGSITLLWHLNAILEQYVTALNGFQTTVLFFSWKLFKDFDNALCLIPAV